jgi:DNA-binding transcriptional LysR family regulator
MELSSQMLLFAKVVESESFSAAARALNHSPSAVSRQIGHLEDRLGVRLVNRSKQGLSLTVEGRAFYERCAEVAARISDAEAYVVSMGAHPQGVLRIVATVAFAKAQVLPIMPQFLERNPDVHLSFELTDRPVDLAAENIDVAIRFTEQIDDSSVIARKLASNRRVICASPAYVERFGRPERAQDLAHHNCLRLSTVTRWNDWHLDEPDAGGPILLRGNFEANSADGIYHATLAGIGIARLSSYLVGDDIKSGRLVRLLPDYSDEGSDVFAIYSDKRNLAPKVRAFIDHLADHFGAVPPWEREVIAREDRDF